MGKLTFVQGGFAAVGGIETFVVDILSAVSARQIPGELICWDAARGSENPGLSKLSEAGVAVHCTSWRWGCRWGWPDKVMAGREWKRMTDAELLVFGKLLHEDIHRQLLRLSKRMILITPYRPAEMWRERRLRPDISVLNSFESMVVQTSSFEEDLRGLGYRGRIVVLPYLPPAISEPTPWPRTDVLQVGFLGRLVPDKNVRYLLDAFSRLRALGAEARLHVYGDGPQRHVLQSLTMQLGLTDQVRFHGSKNRVEIAAAIDRCHIFAFSSSTEGQCMAALEILARGRPVVGTAVGALPDFLDGPLGCIGPLSDPDLYAGAIKAMGRRVLEGKLSPAEVQQAYLRRFERAQIIDEYIRLFDCYEKGKRETQIA
jgi:glycosyltransferase involved in cell wall biosynthesis